jgi:hypothetical protein
MTKRTKQAEAAGHIKELLMHRGFDIPSHCMSLPNNQHWMVFEHKGRQIGIDSATGIWLKASSNDDWRCVAAPHSMSGALMAVEFLTAN